MFERYSRRKWGVGRVRGMQAKPVRIGMLRAGRQLADKDGLEKSEKTYEKAEERINTRAAG